MYCGTDVDCVNKFLVSLYVNLHSIKNTNSFIESFIITKNDQEYYDSYRKFENKVLEKCIDSRDFDIESLIEVFEFVISPKDKIVTGAVYTPKYIREYIIKETLKGFTLEELNRITIVDFACGCGGFLIDAALYIKEKTGKLFKDIYEENLFGIDIKDYSILRTKILLNLLMLQSGEIDENVKFNLLIGNSLDPKVIKSLKQKKKLKSFDVVVGNPPYVCARNIDEESKKLLHYWKVCSVGLPDLYIPFFQIGYENLKKTGKLGFITMNTFFKSLNATALRRYFSKNRIFLRIVDFGSSQVFRSKSTYTCLVFIDKTINSHIEYKRSDPKELNKSKDFHIIKYDYLDDEKGWNLRDTLMVNRIENTGIPLKNLYRIKSGIATLKDRIYIIDPVYEDEMFYYLNTGEKIEKSICKKVINSNKLTKEINVQELIRPIIFPYRHDEQGKAILIAEEDFRENYPNAYKYLLNFREELAKRDKGKKKYPTWYAYGRTQNLEKIKYKMFFPHIAKNIPYFYISEDEDLYHVNGMMAVADTLEDLKLLKIILSSSVFWEYIRRTSKNYSSGFYSLGFRYLKNFGIPNLTQSQKELLLKAKREEIENILAKLYAVNWEN